MRVVIRFAEMSILIVHPRWSARVLSEAAVCVVM